MKGPADIPAGRGQGTPAEIRPGESGPARTRRAIVAGIAAALAAGCGRIEFAAANLPAAFGAYRRHADEAYGTEPRQRLDVYVPDHAVSKSPPLIVFWHGGRWTSGDKSDYRFVGAALAELGFVSMVANYRRYPDVKMAGFMHDTASAAAWAAAHAAEFGASAERLFLMGHSSGAHMAALAALDRRYFASVGAAAAPIAGFIGLSGPYDFLPLHDADTEDMFGPPSHYAESQPINFVRPDAPPMLLVHGLKDETVRPRNSRNLAAALRAQGVAVELELFPELGHADTVAALSKPARGRAPILDEIRAFVTQIPA
jgi:acetyl esterase/lipase